MTAPRDPGLQPERTELAWRRTLLAVAAGAVISVRVLEPVLGVAAVAVGLGGLAVSAALWAAAHRRHARVTAGFGAGGPLPGGGLLGALALLTTLGAAAGLLVTLARA